MKAGERPAHLIPWAPADYLTSRTRMRAIATQDHLLRLVYREVLDVLYAEGGSVPLHALPDLTALPAAEVDRCVAVCEQLGSLVVEGDEVRNPRVTRTLRELEEVRARRAEGGRTGGRPKSAPAKANNLKGGVKVNNENLSGIGIGISPSVEGDKGKGGQGGRATWLTPFGEAWLAALGGEPPWTRLAAELRPVVDRFGPNEALSGWVRYLGDTEPRYASPSAFARRAGAWCPKPKPKPKEVPKLPPSDAAVMRRWREACERVEMPAHLRRTWLSPTEGRFLRDDGLLTVVVPSQQHSDAVKRYADKILAAYNDAEHYDDAPALGIGVIAVVPADATLHDGGL